MDPTYIVAGTLYNGNPTWQAAETIQEAFTLGSAWRAAGTSQITIAAVIPYTATIRVTIGDGQTFELPVPDVPPR